MLTISLLPFINVVPGLRVSTLLPLLLNPPQQTPFPLKDVEIKACVLSPFPRSHTYCINLTAMYQVLVTWQTLSWSLGIHE